MLTVGQMGELLAEPDLTVDQAMNKFRRLAIAGVLKESIRVGAGPKARRVYSAIAPAAAKIIFELTKIGYEDKAVLSSIWEGMLDDTDSGQSTIELIMEDIESGGRPFLTISHFSNGAETCKLASTRLSYEHDRPIVVPDGFELSLSVTVQLHEVLKPFLPKAS